MSRIRIAVLGPVQIEQDGVAISGFESRKAIALLCYVAIQPQPQTRAHLADLFWPEKAETRGRGNLNRVLHNLTHIIPSCLDVSRQTVSLAQDAYVEIDVACFHGYVAEGDLQSLHSAAQLYRGDLLEDVRLDDCPGFEQWLTTMRERWRQRQIQVLHTLAQQHLQQGTYREGMAWAERLLQIDAWREEAHRVMMQLLAASGQRSAALAQYDTCRRLLDEELGVDPDETTTALYKRLLDGIEPPGSEPQITPPTLPVEKDVPVAFYNVPQPTTSFVGREQELAQIVAHLTNPHCHLLTLLGSGGYGKTRLAIQSAQRVRQHFANGVIWVRLERDSSDDFLISAIAQACHFGFSSGIDPASQLSVYLSRKHLLLLIDNGEYLEPEGRWLSQLIVQAPDVKILVASRRRVHIQEEWIIDIHGMPAPTADDIRNSVLEYSAVQLFMQRAQTVQASFVVTADEAKHTAQICRMVAGSPLAIEFAASWVRTLSCREISQEIRRDLDFLSTTMHDVPDRHRSMRAVFEYSWRLLSDMERAVCRKLAIFRGSFDLAAATYVAGATPALLSMLVDKSLVRRIAGQRYLLHELVRQYVYTNLQMLPDEYAQVHVRQYTYYAAFLHERVAPVGGSEASGVTTPIASDIVGEIENIRASWQWAIEYASATQTPELVQFIEDLATWYIQQGWLHEIIHLLSEALKLPLEQVIPNASPLNPWTPDLQRTRWEGQLGTALYNIGQMDQGRMHLEHALTWLGQPGPATTPAQISGILRQMVQQVMHRCWAKRYIGHAAQDDRAMVLELSRIFERLTEVYYLGNMRLHTLYAGLRALNLSELYGPSPELARAYGNIAVAASMIPSLRLLEMYSEQAQSVAQKTQHLPTIAYCLLTTAASAMGYGRWRYLEAVSEQGMQIAEACGNPRLVNEHLANVRYVVYFQGKLADYFSICQRLTLSGQQSGDLQIQAWGLASLSQANFYLGNAEQALQQVEESIQLFGDRFGSGEKIWIYGVLALAYLRNQKVHDALTTAAYTLRLMDITPPGAFFVLIGYTNVAEVYLTLWAANEHQVATDRATVMRGAARICKELERYARIFRIGQPYLCLWHGLYAYLSGDARKAYRTWNKGLLVAQELEMAYVQALLHYSLGFYLSKDDARRRAHAEQAVALFADMQAAYDLKRAQALLDQINQR